MELSLELDQETGKQSQREELLKKEEQENLKKSENKQQSSTYTLYMLFSSTTVQNRFHTFPIHLR